MNLAVGKEQIFGQNFYCPQFLDSEWSCLNALE
jgi:hypothetical protein